MSTVSLKAHFDGYAIQLDEPVELPRDAQLLVTVLSPFSVEAVAESAPLSAARLGEIDAWIGQAEVLAADVLATDGPHLQAAVTEIRRQARELARRGAETSP